MDDDEAPQTIPMSESTRNSAGLSVSRDESAVENRGLSIGGLNDDDGSAESKKRKDGDSDEEAEQPKPKRRRKAKRKRHIVLNEQLELSSAQIRAQLQDASDIVRDVVHPSTWVPGKERDKRRHPNKEKLYATLTYERLFTRPSLGDDGQLAPELLELWGRHTAVVVGKPFPYKLRDSDEQTEQARSGRTDEEGSAGQGSDGQEPDMPDDDGPPMPDDDQPMIDDEGPPVPNDDNFDPAMDEEEEEEGMEGIPDSPDSRDSALSFSLVNDLLGANEDDDEDNPRQTLGSDELTASKAKWHKHTVQVFSLLKSRMSSVHAAASQDEEAEKPSQLSYTALSRGCTRRTAATVFLELLQLKTWDYVELDQDDSFGDITVLPGTKFDDEVPTKG